MKKKIITWSIVIVIIVLFGYYLDKECGVKTVKMGEKVQLGLTGIHLTVLDYKEIEPLKDDQKLDDDKYIAFEVVLEGSKKVRNFAGQISYNLSFLTGETNGKEQSQGALRADDIIQLFGQDFPAIGIGKISKDKKAYGYIIFEVPKDFKPCKFIYKYRSGIDLYESAFPNTEIHVILQTR